MLRVGILLDSYTSSAWVAKIIEDIESSGFARVELVILNTLSAQSRSSLKTRLHNHWNLTLFRLYERWDYQRSKVDHDAMAPTDVSSLLNGIPSISLQSSRSGLTDSIPEDGLAEIRNHDLDILFHFGFRTLRGGILSAAHYGVWSFHHGDNIQYRDDPPLFWEMFERNPVSGSVLQILTDSFNTGRVIYRSYSSTDHTSLYRNRNPLYWKTAEFALRRLRDLHVHGIEYIQSLPTYCEQNTCTRGIMRTPNSLQMILFMSRHLFRWLQARVASLRSNSRTKWYLAVRWRTDVHGFDDPYNYRLILSPKDRFYADPFLVKKDGKTFLFFEDYRYAEGRAVISYCELETDGRAGLPVEALRRPYHLSYPFILEVEGEMYMIPETKGNRTVELYRATSFPTTWKAEAVLLSDINAVDATIQRINGKFWMFAGVSNGTYSNCDELSLFFADAITGPWTPHRCNPVLSDVRRSRPAGALFYDKGRLIRPSQDCGKSYGYALVFSLVLTLNENEYEEQVIGRLDPDLAQGVLGTHTYTRTEQFEVIDRELPARIAGAARNNWPGSLVPGKDGSTCK